MFTPFPWQKKSRVASETGATSTLVLITVHWPSVWLGELFLSLKLMNSFPSIHFPWLLIMKADLQAGQVASVRHGPKKQFYGSGSITRASIGM